jgi:hypothetical protein
LSGRRRPWTNRERKCLTRRREIEGGKIEFETLGKFGKRLPILCVAEVIHLLYIDGERERERERLIERERGKERKREREREKEKEREREREKEGGKREKE